MVELVVLVVVEVAVRVDYVVIVPPVEVLSVVETGDAVLLSQGTF